MGGIDIEGAKAGTIVHLREKMEELQHLSPPDSAAHVDVNWPKSPPVTAH